MQKSKTTKTQGHTGREKIKNRIIKNEREE